MGNSIKIKYSKARKYFVCDKPFELVEHPDGIYAKSITCTWATHSNTSGFALGAYWADMKFDGHYFLEVLMYFYEILRGGINA